MAFKMSVQKYSGKISEVEIGKGEKAIMSSGEGSTTEHPTRKNTKKM